MIASPDSREPQSRILDAAEALFARHGYDGTSIREITRSAEVNVAAVHYHYGSKEAVLRAVTDRVAGPISTRRTALLEQAIIAAHPDAPTLEQLLDAFVRADVEMLLALQDRGPTVAWFLGRTYADQTPWIQEMAGDQFREADAFYPLLAAALPHLTPDELTWRMRQVVAVIVHQFATWPADGMDEAAAATVLARLVTFLAAALRAPQPADANRGGADR